MVATSPEDLRANVAQFSRESTLPSSLAFIEYLSPLHQRLFIRDLWELCPGAP